MKMNQNNFFENFTVIKDLYNSFELIKLVYFESIIL